MYGQVKFYIPKRTLLLQQNTTHHKKPALATRNLEHHEIKIRNKHNKTINDINET